MKMKHLPILVFAYALLCLGCSSQDRFKDLQSRIDQRLKAMTSENEPFDVRSFKELADSIDTENDLMVREKGYRHLEKKLLSFKIDKFSYRQQSSHIGVLLAFGYHEGMGSRSTSVRETWEVRLRVLDRIRRELCRLRLVIPADVKDMDCSTYVAYRRWRDCYNGVARVYEKTLRRMENSLLPSVLEELPENERALFVGANGVIPRAGNTNIVRM